MGQLGKPQYLIMLSENEFESHPSSEKMKCLIGDCIRNENGSVLFGDSEFLLFVSRSRQADLHLISKQFTHIQQSHRIKEIDSLLSCAKIKREACFIFVYTAKNEVIVLFSEYKVNGYQPIHQRAKTQYKFEANDGFKCLSKPFKITQGEGILAYSQKDEFYLICLAERGREVSLQVTKLNDPQKPNNLWSWLTRQKQPHYEQVELISLNDDQNNGFRFLCLRDNTAAVFYVAYKEEVTKSTIRQQFACSTLPSEINSSSKLLSTCLLSQKLALVTYSLKQKVFLVKMLIFQEENSLICEKIAINTSQSHFKLVQCKEFLYLCAQDSITQRYKCFKIPSDLKQLTSQSSLDEIEPIFESFDPIQICANKKDVFLINDHNIYKIEEDRDHHGVREQAKKYQSFERWIDRTINKKIKKNTLQQNYENVSICLQQKEQKIIDQYQHLSQEGLQLVVSQKITESIICSSIVKTILSKKPYFNKFLQLLEHPKIQEQVRAQHQESFIDKILLHPTPINIESFLKLTVRLEMFQYFNDILIEVSKHSLRTECKTTINQIFAQVCQETIHSFKTNHRIRDIIQHKILLEFTFRSIDLQEQRFVDDFLFLSDEWREDEVIFVHNLVLNLKLADIFMHLFVKSEKKIFTTQDFTEIIKDLNVSKRQIYFHNFFTQLKQAYDDSEGDLPRKQSLLQRAGILARGLASYQNQIYGILQQTFPGLLVYFYLKSKHKKQFEPQIEDIAKQCSTPIAAYMLFLSTPGSDKKQWRQTLEKIRLCKLLCLHYNHNGDVLKDIEDKRNLKKIISARDWQKSIEILEVPAQRAERIGKTLQITV